MDAKKRIVVAGARGVFGSLLVEELRGDYEVIATTRDTLNLNDVDAVANAARGAFAFACCAGPFQPLDRRIVPAVVNEGVHWLDIADDANWFFDLIDDRELDALARERHVVVMPGLSSLPAISCALVHKLNAKRADITLFIGNDNRKGAGAIASGAALNAPDRELLRREGIEATVRARFELPGAKLGMRALSALPLKTRVKLAKTLSRLIPRFGRSGGWVEVNGVRIEGGQRLAILPLVFALRVLRGVIPSRRSEAEDGRGIPRLRSVHGVPAGDPSTPLRSAQDDISEDDTSQKDTSQDTSLTGCLPPTHLDPEALLDFVACRAADSTSSSSP